jgi:hypothetical protein
MLCVPVSVVLLTWGRRWVPAIGAVGLTVAMFAVEIPLYLGSDANRIAGVEVRVMSANIYEGMADAHHLVRSARAQADVIAVQELTPRAVDRLSAAGLDATFPYWWLDARGASAGVGMWSRHPIQAPSRIDGYTMAFISAPSTDHRYLDESHRRRRPHPRSLAIPDRRLATRPGSVAHNLARDRRARRPRIGDRRGRCEQHHRHASLPRSAARRLPRRRVNP